MKIVALDMSVTHTGAVKMELTNGLKIEKVDWLTFTTTQKYACDNCIWYDNDFFVDKYEKYKFMHDRIIPWCMDADLVCAEDYAMGASSASGLVFDLAEFEGWIRQTLWRAGKPLYLYSPGTIKMVFTGHGDCDKKSMWNAYQDVKLPKPDLTYMPIVTNGKKGAPGTSDVIDAYACAIVLLTELQIERGDRDLKDFPKNVQKFWKNRTRSVLQKPREERIMREPKKVEH